MQDIINACLSGIELGVLEGLQITGKAVLIGPRTGRLRNRLFELASEENVLTKWTVNACRYRLAVINS